jgi:hypothetical protein
MRDTKGIIPIKHMKMELLGRVFKILAVNEI